MAERKNDLFYLLHIVEAMDRISSHLGFLEHAQFGRDPLVQDAVIRQIEIIGEAARHVSEATRSSYQSVPWRIMAGMRDKLIHDYFAVDLQAVWETARREIPSLRPVIERIISELKGAE